MTSVIYYCRGIIIGMLEIMLMWHTVMFVSCQKIAFWW